MKNDPYTKLFEEFDKEYLERPYEEGIIYETGDELKDFIRKHTIPRSEIEKMRKKGESVPIPCPEGKAGCLVMHYSKDKFITEEIRGYNQALDDLLNK